MYYDEQSILCFGQAEEFLSKNSENSGWEKNNFTPGRTAVRYERRGSVPHRRPLGHRRTLQEQVCPPLPASLQHTRYSAASGNYEHSRSHHTIAPLKILQWLPRAFRIKGKCLDNTSEAPSPSNHQLNPATCFAPFPLLNLKHTTSLPYHTLHI